MKVTDLDGKPTPPTEHGDWQTITEMAEETYKKTKALRGKEYFMRIVNQARRDGKLEERITTRRNGLGGSYKVREFRIKESK